MKNQLDSRFFNRLFEALTWRIRMKINGLSDKEAEQSREKYGSNTIPDSEPTTFWEEGDLGK